MSKKKETRTQRWLRLHNACEEARRWVGSMTLQEAWSKCERLDWLYFVATAEANRQYEAATAEPRRQYQAARAEANRQYEAAMAEPRRQYEAAVVEANRQYEAATAEANWQYEAAVVEANPCDYFRSKIKCPGIYRRSK